MHWICFAHLGYIHVVVFFLISTNGNVAAFGHPNVIRAARNSSQRRERPFRWAAPRRQGPDDAGKEQEIENEEEEEDVSSNNPYQNRSLTWTNRYRRLIPYESARARAMSLGLRSKAEWDEYQVDRESCEHGPYLPNKPDLMYPNEWVSWEEFLGIMRPYEEARGLVRTLGIQNWDAYQDFVRSDKKRAEGLRIPAKPHIFYRDKGWTSFEDFFGCFD